TMLLRTWLKLGAAELAGLTVLALGAATAVHPGARQALPETAASAQSPTPATTAGGDAIIPLKSRLRWLSQLRTAISLRLLANWERLAKRPGSTADRQDLEVWFTTLRSEPETVDDPEEGVVILQKLAEIGETLLGIEKQLSQVGDGSRRWLLEVK